MTPYDTNTLTQLLAAKCELLVQLRQLSVRQNELIDAGELGQLFNLLAVKQRLLTAMQAIEGKLDPYRHQSPEQRQWSSANEHRRCAELVDQCERLLAELVEAEKHSETQLIRRRDEAATRLQAVHYAAQARGAYVEPGTPVINQVDLSSE